MAASPWTWTSVSCCTFHVALPRLLAHTEDSKAVRPESNPNLFDPVGEQWRPPVPMDVLLSSKARQGKSKQAQEGQPFESQQLEDCEGALRDFKSHALPTPPTTRSPDLTRRAADMGSKPLESMQRSAGRAPRNMTDCMPSVCLKYYRMLL